MGYRLSCSPICGILVPQPGIKPASLALQGVILTTGPPGKSQAILSNSPLIAGHLAAITNKSVHTFLGSAVNRSGLLRWLSGKESTCQYRRRRRHGFDPWVGKIPRRRKLQLMSVFLSGKSHGQSSLAGYSPWGHKESHAHEKI